jgi:hypothetical protein
VDYVGFAKYVRWCLHEMTHILLVRWTASQ